MAASSATVAMAGVVPSTTPSLNSCSPSSSKFVSLKPAFVPVRAGLQQISDDSVSTRRSLLGLLVAAPSVLLAADALAEASPVKVEPPPLPFGGLPGTQNADQPRELERPLKDRFFIQPLTPEKAVARAKDSANEIIAVKKYIDKKAWPYVQNDLRNKATCLRYDLNTIISAKSKDEKKAFKSLVAKLFETLDGLDFAARSKSVPKAQKYYGEAVTALNDVISKLG